MHGIIRVLFIASALLITGSMAAAKPNFFSEDVFPADTSSIAFVTGEFGELRTDPNVSHNGLHSGIDLAVPSGTAVHAPFRYTGECIVAEPPSSYLMIRATDKNTAFVAGHITTGWHKDDHLFSNDVLGWTVGSHLHAEIQEKDNAVLDWGPEWSVNPRLYAFDNVTTWTADTQGPAFTRYTQDHYGNTWDLVIGAYDRRTSTATIRNGVYQIALYVDGNTTAYVLDHCFDTIHGSSSEIYSSGNVTPETDFEYFFRWRAPDDEKHTWQVAIWDLTNDPVLSVSEEFTAEAPSGVSADSQDGRVHVSWQHRDVRAGGWFDVLAARSKVSGFAKVNSEPIWRCEGQDAYSYSWLVPVAWDSVYVHVVAEDQEGHREQLGEQAVRIERASVIGVKLLPNPSAGAYSIETNVPEAGEVRIEVFGVDGRLVARPFLGRAVAGRLLVEWDGRDDGGIPVVSGQYYVAISLPGVRNRLTRKMTVMK